MKDAFDWAINTQDGVDLFRKKLSLATTNEKSIQSTHTGLRDLTSLELENMAIELYGPFPGGLNLNKQYYIPSCVGGTSNGHVCTGGNWDWVINTTGNAHGVNYVAQVKKYAQ